MAHTQKKRTITYFLLTPFQQPRRALAATPPSARTSRTPVMALARSPATRWRGRLSLSRLMHRRGPWHIRSTSDTTGRGALMLHLGLVQNVRDFADFRGAGVLTHGQPVCAVLWNQCDSDECMGNFVFPEGGGAARSCGEVSHASQLTSKPFHGC